MTSLDAALDGLDGAGPAEVERDGGSATVEALDVDRLGVRVRKVRVEREADWDLSERAYALPERLRHLERGVGRGAVRDRCLAVDGGRAEVEHHASDLERFPLVPRVVHRLRDHSPLALGDAEFPLAVEVVGLAGRLVGRLTGLLGLRVVGPDVRITEVVLAAVTRGCVRLKKIGVPLLASRQAHSARQQQSKIAHAISYHESPRLTQP